MDNPGVVTARRVVDPIAWENFEASFAVLRGEKEPPHLTMDRAIPESSFLIVCQRW